MTASLYSQFLSCAASPFILSNHTGLVFYYPVTDVFLHHWGLLCTKHSYFSITQAFCVSKRSQRHVFFNIMLSVSTSSQKSLIVSVVAAFFFFSVPREPQRVPSKPRTSPSPEVPRTKPSKFIVSLPSYTHTGLMDSLVISGASYFYVSFGHICWSNPWGIKSVTCRIYRQPGKLKISSVLYFILSRCNNGCFCTTLSENKSFFVWTCLYSGKVKVKMRGVIAKRKDSALAFSDCVCLFLLSQAQAFIHTRWFTFP